MSETKGLSPEETMRAIQEQAAADAIDEVLALDEGALDAHLREQGEDPQEVVAATEAALLAALAAVPVAAEPSAPATPAVAPVIPLRKAKAASSAVPWRTWVPLAAAAALLIVLGGMKRRAVVAWIRGDAYELGPAPDWTPPSAEPPQPAGNPAAAALRAEGLKACDESIWFLCSTKLNDARAMDPEGENLPEVRAARRKLADEEGKKPPMR